MASTYVYYKNSIYRNRNGHTLGLIAMILMMSGLVIWVANSSGYDDQVHIQRVDAYQFEDQLQRQPYFSKQEETSSIRHINDNDNDIHLQNPELIDNDNIDTFDVDTHNRHLAYTKYCSSSNNTLRYNDVNSIITTDNDFKMAYCVVAKIGCTFWLRIFTFLTRKDEMDALGIKTPFDIDRIALHSGKLMTKIRMKHSTFLSRSRPDTVSFLFTRNPYERLWSVYLDKYFLPDYWLYQPLGPSQCGINTTFVEFLNYAVTSTDHHLTPVSKACNPCVYKPEVIGKMETFSRDSKHILDKAGYSSILQNYNHTTYSEIELKTLIAYNFQLINNINTFVKNCITPKALAERLWHVFQINGHIRDSTPFPSSSSDSSSSLGGSGDGDEGMGGRVNYASVKSVTELFLDSVRRQGMSKDDSNSQRTRHLVDAYSKLSPSLLVDIQHKYKDDFALFGYDIEPI